MGEAIFQAARSSSTAGIRRSDLVRYGIRQENGIRETRSSEINRSLLRVLDGGNQDRAHQPGRKLRKYSVDIQKRNHSNSRVILALVHFAHDRKILSMLYFILLCLLCIEQKELLLFKREVNAIDANPN